jgi:hypothetical protein
LAIGDGGNDVPMIMEAHIGVGIYGEEGLRAVQSSDYAMGEFKILRELLFSHGRMNYVRNSECIQYFFFKNFVQTFNHYIYGFFCNFTGQTIIDDWFISLYNLLFTSLPLGTKAILDTDIKRDDGLIIYKMLPFIYKENRDNPIFTIVNFILSLFKGLIFSLINTFFVINTIKDTYTNKKGLIPGLWFMSVDIYTNILIIVTSTLIITTRFHTWIHGTILFLVSFLAYIIFLVFVQYLPFFNSVGTMKAAFNSPILWLNILLVSGLCGLIEFFILAYKFVFKPNTVRILQKYFNERGIINSSKNLPKSILEKINIYDNIDEKLEENDKNINKEIAPDKPPYDEKKEEVDLINNNNSSLRTRRERDNSTDILLRKIQNEKINSKFDINILNVDADNKNTSSIDEDYGENFKESYSEKMSNENNLYFKKDYYISEPFNFDHKIIYRKNQFDET